MGKIWIISSFSLRNKKSSRSIYIFFYFYKHRLIHNIYGVVNLNSGHKSITCWVYIWIYLYLIYIYIYILYIYIYIYIFLSMYLFNTSLVSSFEHFWLSALCSRAARWNYKTTEYLSMKGVLGSIQLRMLRRAHYLPTRFPANYEILMAFCSCKRVTLKGCNILSLI